MTTPRPFNLRPGEIPMSSSQYLRWRGRKQRRPPIVMPTELEIREWAEKVGWLPAANDNGELDDGEPKGDK